MNENDKGQEDLILELRNLQDEVDSCISGELESKHLDKQEQEFIDRDCGKPIYLPSTGHSFVLPPRRHFKEEVRILEEENKQLKERLKEEKDNEAD